MTSTNEQPIHDIVEVLSEYALGVSDDLAPIVQDEVRRKLVDVTACALAALHQPATHAVRRYVYGVRAPGDSLVWGTGLRTSASMAALANGTAVRCLDFNDGYQGARGDAGGHPSDVLPCLIAVAERVRASGAELCAAIAVAYEVMVSLADGWPVKSHAVLDHVNAQSLAACCGIARLTGMSRAQLREALSITAVAHVGLWQARKNKIRMWKSVASSNSMRNAIESCLMASAGVQGPSLPFDGTSGLIHASGDIAIEWSELSSLLELEQPTKIRNTNMKCWPIGQVGQSSVDVAIALHPKMPKMDDVKEIVISTFASASRSMCRPDNWNPQTRESADHSIPYGTVAALLDGTITNATFHEDRLDNSGIREILQTKVRVEVLDEFTAAYPQAQPARVEVVLTDGTRLMSEAQYPRGHARNPNRVGDEDYRRKFRDYASGVLGHVTDEVLAHLEAVRTYSNVRELVSVLAL